MRWLALTAVLLGALVGVAFPGPEQGLAGTGRTFVASMLPPSGSSGQYPMLTCGWHTGACDSRYESGINLDWDDTPGNVNVYFRGLFSRTGASGNTLKGQPVEQYKGPTVCDTAGVWIIEVYNGGLRAVPVYMHMNLSTTSVFYIYTTGTGSYYHSRVIGYMIDDAGCTGQWKHVHEYHTPDEVWDSTPNVTETINTSKYPNGDYCFWDGDPSDCRTYYNQSSSNWTRRFTWEEGS